MIELKDCARLLKGAEKIEIFTHTHPDGDAIGSAYALAAALKKLGKTARVTINDTLPENFKYIYGAVKTEEFIPDFTVSVDLASMSLLGDFPEDKAFDLAIDHHLKNTVRTNALYCDPGAAACGEIIFELISLLGAELDLYLAQCLYTAIATDTGCFKFSNTTSRTFSVASKLCAYAPSGNFGYLNTPLFSTKSRKQIQLECEVLSNLSYYFSSRVAIASLTFEMLERLSLTDNDTAGVEQLAKLVEGVVIGITLKERDRGFKVSMRSDDSVDVSAICADFGGGGHHSAAGCFIEGSRDEVEKKLVEYFEGRDLL